MSTDGPMSNTTPPLPEPDTAAHRIGIIGVGEIASAIVEALLAGPNAGTLEFALSPRSLDRSRGLAERYERVRVAASNQQVVHGADVVMIAVLPEHVEAVCRELTLSPDQTIIGLAAGWAPSRLAPLVTPATDVCQLIPLPMVRLHAGPMALFPRIPAVESLFGGCGTIVVPASEQQLPILSCASATMSTFFAAQQAIVEWMAARGFDRVDAGRYVAALLSGLAAESTEIHDGDLARLVPSHETPGGLNQQMRETLEKGGAFRDIDSGLQSLMARLSN